MITLEQARVLLPQAVATQPKGFRYIQPGKIGCYYAPVTTALSLATQLAGDDPRRITGCLIGVAISLSGERRHLEVNGSVSVLKEVFPDMLTAEAVDYFIEAQTIQDNGGTWQEAYEKAEASLGENKE